VVIAVNARLLLKNKLEGIGRFSYETLKIITQSNPDHQFIFIFDRPYDPEFIFSENIIPVVVKPQARHPFLFYWWFEKSLHQIFNKYNPDIFFSPDGYLSLSAKVKSVAVIHDLNFEHYPRSLPFLVRHYYQYFFPKFAQKAARIATVSEFSKKDIVKKYQIAPDLVDVVYNGVSASFLPIEPNHQNTIREEFTSGKPFFLYVGSIHPRKNISNLLKAFDLFKTQTQSDNKLVFAGEKYYWTSEMQSTFDSLLYQKDVIFTGRLNDQKLSGLLASANALTYLSIFEGFGIPMIEAMQSGVPVIASDATALPEIAGGAALLCDPFDVGSIADAMQKIEEDKLLRKRLIESGFVRVKHFSWEKTAEKLWNTIVTAHKL
jgi:glycosyltransferase involved in cell wall biosynthesis